MCAVDNYGLVSMCNIVMMEDNWVLASSWFEMVYLKNLCFCSLISHRNGSVFATNIWILFFKWITSENSKSIISWAVGQTLQHSLIPLFFGTPCIKKNIQTCEQKIVGNLQHSFLVFNLFSVSDIHWKTRGCVIPPFFWEIFLESVLLSSLRQ